MKSKIHQDFMTKDKTAWGNAIGYGTLTTVGINILALIFGRLLNKDLNGVIISEVVFTLFPLIAGLILIIMFHKKTLGWTFLIGSLLNIIVWTYLIWLLSSHGV